MRAWVIPTTIFFVGLGLGVSGPIIATQYMEPYMPNFFKKPLNPLEGMVTHKQRDQDRLLMTITTQDGTILATFRQQIAEIDLLVEEQDLITLNVRQYEPFVTDPLVLKVNKQIPQVQIPNSAPASPPISSIEQGHLPDSQLESGPSTGESSEKTESILPPKT